MPSYTIDIPGKGSYTVNSPTDLTDYQAYLAAQRQVELEAQQQKLHETRTGFIPAVKAGAREFLGGAEEALGFKEAAEEQRQKAAATFEPTTEEDIARAKEKGIFPTAGAYLSQKITEPLGGMIGRYGAPTIAGMAAPEAAVAGIGARALTFGAADLPASIGESMEAQKAAGQEVNPVKAIAAGLAKTTIATIGMPGVGKISEALGPKVSAEAEALAPRVAAGAITKEEALAQLSGRAKSYAQSMLANTVAGTGMMLGTEAVERFQTGQEQQTPEEMLQTAGQAALLSPIFAALHPSGRKAAEAKLTEAQQAREKEYADILASRYKLASLDERAQMQRDLADQELQQRIRDQIHAQPDRSVQDIINEATGISKTEPEIRRTKEDIEAALNEPSGQYVSDPITGVERELTVGELQKIQRPDLFPEEPANIVTTETLTDLGIKKNTPIIKKGGLAGLDLNKPEEAQQFIEGLSLFKEQPKLDPTVKLRIEAKIKEVQDKLKGLEDERLRTERDRENIQVSRESLGGGAEGDGKLIGAGDIQSTVGLRSVEGGKEVRGPTLKTKAPESTEVMKGEGETKFAKDEGDVGYHAGDLGFGFDTVLGRMGGRSTGHFGTGVYFVGAPEKLGTFRSDRPVKKVDFSEYNLAKPKTRENAFKLHDGLKDINDIVDVVAEGIKEWPGYWGKINSVKEYISRAAKQIKESINPKESTADIEKIIKEELDKAAPKYKENQHTSNYIPSVSTEVMKRLGFQGVDVRGLPDLDNTAYGSVIYEKSLANKAKAARGQITSGVEKEKLITALKDRFGNNVNKAMQRGDVNVVSMDELAKLDPELHATIPADAQAFFHKGKAYLLHDRMTEQEAPRKLLHEVGAHFGLEGMVGKEAYRNILRELNRLKLTDKNVADAFTHVNNRYKELAEGSHGHLEEVLARLGESAPNHTVWRRIVAAVKNFLIKKGLWNPNKMDIRDIHDLINRSTERSLAGKIKAEEAKPKIQYAKGELPISDRFKETKVFSPPGEDQERSFKEFATGTWEQFKTPEGKKELQDSANRAFLDGRIKVAYAGAGVQSKLIKDFNGAVLNATNNVRADILYDQALNGNILGSVSAKEGRIVFDDSGVAKVEPSPYHISTIFDELGSLSKKIGGNDAKHVASAYLQALRYKDILANNARLKDLISKTKNESLKKQYEKDIKTVTADQEAGIAPALAYGEEFPEVKKMAEIYDKVNRDEIDMLEKAGIYSKDYADKLRNTKGYVPLYRVMDDLENVTPGARQHFRGLADIGKQHAFEGSERQSLDVLDNMLTRHMWAVNAAVRNNANRMLAKQLAIRGENGQIDYHYKPSAENMDRMAPIWENGSRKYVEYTDPHFAQAVYGLEPSLGPILGFMGKASRALRIGVTATPTFQVYQLFNDAPRVAMLSGVNHPFKLMGEVFTSFYKALKDPNDPIMQEMHRLGISGGFGHTAKDIADKMRRDLGLAANTLTKRALDKTESFAAASDMAQRRAVFKRTLLETGGVENADGSITGGNKVLAMDRAMNIIHWQKHGTSNKIRVLTQVVPFLNAYIQGMDTLIRAMRGEGISGMEKKQAQLLFAQTALKIAALSTIYSMAVAGDDEYQKLDDRQKIRSFIIPGTGIKIPVASEVAMLTKAIPEMTWQYINREGTENPMDSTKLMSAIGTSFADGLLGPNLMPQAFRAGVEVATNHDFLTGHPIVGRGLENLETSQQFTENTSELAKLIGKTGVISPLNLDHLLRGYGGTMASSVLFASDAGLNMFYNDKLPTTPIYRIPMIGSFMYSPEGKGQLNDYYDLKNRSDEVTATLNHLKKFGTPEEVLDYITDNREMMAIRNQVNNISSRMKMLREQRKHIIASNLSSDEKRAQIDEIDARINNMVQNIGALRVKAGL